MIGDSKIKRGIAAFAALGALALGGAAIAGAANNSSSAAPETQSEAAEGPENQAAEGPEQGGGSESGDSEQEDSITGPDADRAAAAAEQATGGKAVDVSKDNVAGEKAEGADDDGGGQGGFQSPANAAYEVAVDKNGKEVDVYLDKDFQVITTQAGDAGE